MKSPLNNHEHLRVHNVSMFMFEVEVGRYVYSTSGRLEAHMPQAVGDSGDRSPLEVSTCLYRPPV